MATVQTATATAPVSATPDRATGLTGDLQSFLRLLTTQLQNQDPLKPTDSTQFVTQLAMFAQAEQGVNTNRRLDTILDLVRGQMLSDASAFLGQEVLAVTDTLSFDGKAPVRFTYDVPAGIDELTVEVLDDQGRPVRSVQGRSDAGHYQDIWDGTTDAGAVAAPGAYQLRVTGRQADDRSGTTAKTLETSIYGRVEEMRVSEGEVVAVVAGEEVPIARIRALSGSGAGPATATD